MTKMTNNLREVLPKLGEVIRETSLALENKTTNEMALKWDRGKIGEMKFVRIIDGKWKMKIANSDDKDNIKGGYVKGLLAKFFDVQILIDKSCVPDTINFDGDMDIDTVTKIMDNKHEFKTNVIDPISDRLNVHILPLVKGKLIKFGGSEYLRLVALYKHGDFMTTVKSAFKKAFGVELHTNMFIEIAKTMIYLATSVADVAPMIVDVKQYDSSIFIDPDIADGAMFYLPQKNCKYITHMEIPFRNGTHSVKLDGRTLHMRGISNIGTITKCTLRAWTIRNIKKYIKEEFHGEIIDAAINEFIIATDDTLKYTEPGTYTVDMYFHDDSAMHPILTSGKLLFEQLFRKMVWTRTGGVRNIIDSIVKKTGRSLMTGRSMVKTMARNEDAYNLDQMPNADFVDLFMQVLNDLPMGLNSSLINAIRLALPYMFKKMAEVPIGTKRYFAHNSGDLIFDWDEHHGIYLYGFLSIDVTLGSEEASLPRGIYDVVEKILKLTNKTWDDVTNIFKRCPILMTNTQKVTIIRRDDNFGYIGLSTHIMRNVGGDSDGDKGSITITLNDMFDFAHMSDVRVHNMVKTMDTDKINAVKRAVVRLSTYRPVSNKPFKNIEDGIASMIYELRHADSIGLIDNGLLKAAYHLAIQKGWTRDMIALFTFMMEIGSLDDDGNVDDAGILQAIIDSKKVAAERVPNIMEFLQILNDAKMGSIPDGFNLLRGKVSFVGSEVEYYDHNTGETKVAKNSVDLALVPAMIKNMAREALYGTSTSKIDKDTHLKRMRVFFPIHTMYFESILKHFPDEMKDASFDYSRYLRRGGVKDNSKDLADTIVSMYPALTKHFVVTKYDTDSHVMLEEYSRKMADILDSDIPLDDAYTKINKMKCPTFDNIVNMATSDINRAVIELMLVACATENAGPNGSRFSFIFNYVHPATITTYFQLIHDRGDPNKYFRTKDNPMRKDAYLYGDMHELTTDLKAILANNYNIVGTIHSDTEVIPSNVIAIADDEWDDKKVFYKLKDGGTSTIEFLKWRPRKAEWYHATMKLDTDEVEIHN